MFNFVNQSCFDFLPEIESNSIDLVLIDPPYVVSRDTNLEPTEKDTDRFRVSFNFGSWNKEETDMPTVIKECYRILKDGGTLLCFYDLWKITILKEYFEAAKFKQLRFLEWVKTNPVPINARTNYLTNAREIAVTGVKKAKPTFNSSYDVALYRYPIIRKKDRFHPTQKPLALIRDLIKKHSNSGDLVLDCFAGSASTGVAALLEGRNFVGCELSEEYYSRALERLQKTVEETKIKSSPTCGGKD